MPILHRFLNDTSGNFAMMLGLALSAIILCGGGATDFGRLFVAKAEAQKSIDAASLATASAITSGLDDDEAVQKGIEMFWLNNQTLTQNVEQTPVINVTRSGSNISIEASVEGGVAAYFSWIAGIDTLAYNVNADSTFGEVRDEITLVLDTSASMYGANIARSIALKDAASQFVDLVQPFSQGSSYRIINLVPYGGRVGFGDEYAFWLGPDSPQNPHQHFAGCFEPGGVTQATELDIPTPGPGAYKSHIPLVRENFNGNVTVPTCPELESQVQLFETDVNLLKDRINGMTPVWGTSSDLALGWGWRTLNAEWRPHFLGPDLFPRLFQARNRKILIFLTDGGVVRVNDGADAPGQVFIGLTDRDPNGLNHFNAVCDAIKTQGEINVYMIGFELPQNGAIVDAMQNCTSGEGSFFNAENSDVGQIFSDIAADIVPIRLTN